MVGAVFYYASFYQAEVKNKFYGFLELTLKVGHKMYQL